MAAAAILKIAFWVITHQLIFWFQRNFALGRPRDKKLKIFKIQDGGRPPFWKSLYRHISVKNCPISLNLVYCIRYWTRWQPRDQKLKFLKFKMAAAAILKIGFLAIIHRPIVRFQRNFVRSSRTACRYGLHDKNCKFLKSKMADGRHFENG